jgi:hypothetical protein
VNPIQFLAPKVYVTHPFLYRFYSNSSVVICNIVTNTVLLDKRYSTCQFKAHLEFINDLTKCRELMKLINIRNHIYPEPCFTNLILSHVNFNQRIHNTCGVLNL